MLPHRRSLLIGIGLALSGLLGFIFALSLQKNTPVTQRTFHNPTTLMTQLANDPQAGEKIFNTFCAACHAAKPLILTSAPRIGDKKAWQALHTPDLLAIAIQGKGVMPARGGCFECSDEELRKTIQYMVEKSR